MAVIFCILTIFIIHSTSYHSETCLRMNERTNELFDWVLVTADSAKQNTSKHQHEWIWWLLAHRHCR